MQQSCTDPQRQDEVAFCHQDMPGSVLGEACYHQDGGDKEQQKKQNPKLQEHPSVAPGDPQEAFTGRTGVGRLLGLQRQLQLAASQALHFPRNEFLGVQPGEAGALEAVGDLLADVVQEELRQVADGALHRHEQPFAFRVRIHHRQRSPKDLESGGGQEDEDRRSQQQRQPELCLYR